MSETETHADFVVVGAHPDDCEIGCGGTMASLVAQGFRVAIIDLTDGEPTPLCEHPDIRLEEAHAAAKVLGVHERKVLTLPNRRLFDTFEARIMLATELRRLRPRVVLALHGKTPLASPDHWQAMQITEAAVFYSRLSKWDGHFGDLPPHRIEHQLYYSLGFESVWGAREANSIVVDISETLTQKMAAVSCFQTQFPPEKKQLFERVESMARSLGAAAGFAAGELLFSSKIPGVKNLGQFLLA